MENNTKTPPAEQAATTDTEISLEAKTIAIISYITLIGLIIAFVMNNDKKADFSTYHIKQALGIGLTGLALGVVGMIPILGWIASFLGTIALIYLWIMGLVNAVNAKKKPVPWLGKKYEEWFKNI
ncbi:DUF4870 domain-containing protein [Psychroflexus halocasei]|uniref:Uncharacterized membrane protein n=1 Tax=Psychroflexus halocasei TaxID=908615 RepID=A0A1H4AG18_9FLAO|nr:hypothetical protein [Psychroflexus halocasei]SEA34816.1 Uncharacterized membrane protein [Psychroflexus halocasei]